MFLNVCHEPKRTGSVVVLFVVAGACKRAYKNTSTLDYTFGYSLSARQEDCQR